jgi:hypothetical protein
VTPIFVRPVREQLEHDRLIRFLLNRYKRKLDVAINVGDQQLASVKLGTNTFFPDLILTEGKKLAGLVEVESSESTNNLEAMSQWTHFSRARVPFHLYVPVLMVDAARRLCDANQVAVSEIWTYRAVNDQFDLVRVFHDPNAVKTGSKLAPKVIQFVKVVPPPPPPPVPEPVPEPVKPVVAPKPVPAGKGVFVQSLKTAANARPTVPAKVLPAKDVQPTTPVKAAKAAKPVPPVKPVKVSAPAKAAKPQKSAKPAKSVKSAKAGKPVKAAKKAARPAKSAKPVKKRK